MIGAKFPTEPCDWSEFSKNCDFVKSWVRNLIVLHHPWREYYAGADRIPETAPSTKREGGFPVNKDLGRFEELKPRHQL